MIHALLNEAYLLCFALTFQWDVINYVDSSIHELFLWEEAREYELSVVQVKSMEVLCLDFLLSEDCNPVEAPQLRDMEEHLKPVELAVL